MSLPRFGRAKEDEIDSHQGGNNQWQRKSNASSHKNVSERPFNWLRTSGKSMTQIARDVGISDSALHAWRKQFAAHGNQAFPGKGHQTELEEENRRLRRENDILKQEREVLKKLGWQTWGEKVLLQGGEIGLRITTEAELTAATLVPIVESLT
jgi:transposase